MQIYEGERQIASKNSKLGVFAINGLRQGMAGTVSVSLTLSIDLNGMLHATADHEVFLIIIKFALLSFAQLISIRYSILSIIPCTP
jgi:molecular chaperone DnaK (HSP70)